MPPFRAFLTSRQAAPDAPRGTLALALIAALHLAAIVLMLWSESALVVALGLDAHEGDPYQTLAVTTAGFGRIMAEVARLGLPTVLVQEGGYLSDNLGANLASALAGFERAA